ncbi:hypothetical protein QFZ91_005675 [Paraburkholderia sp. JPY419]
MARRRYGGCQISPKRALPTVTARSTRSTGAGSAFPHCSITFASSACVTLSASSRRPCCASQRGLSGTRRRIAQTTNAPSEPMTTTQRHPSMPHGVRGTSHHANSATAGTAAYCTTCTNAKARPRRCIGTSSLTYVSIVTNSTPTPMPAIRRHRLIADALSCQAITKVATEYQSSETVKVVLRPKRSARRDKQNVPMKRPANDAATNAPSPEKPKNDAVVVEYRPLLTRPGPTYAVKNRS